MVKGLLIAQCPSRSSNPTPVSSVTSPADLGSWAQSDWGVFASHHPGADVMSLTMHSRVKNEDGWRTHQSLDYNFLLWRQKRATFTSGRHPRCWGSVIRLTPAGRRSKRPPYCYAEHDVLRVLNSTLSGVVNGHTHTLQSAGVKVAQVVSGMAPDK